MTDTETTLRGAAIGLLSGLEVLAQCRPYRGVHGWHEVGGWAFAEDVCPACRLRVALKAKDAGGGECKD